MPQRLEYPRRFRRRPDIACVLVFEPDVLQILFTRPFGELRQRSLLHLQSTSPALRFASRRKLERFWPRTASRISKARSASLDRSSNV